MAVARAANRLRRIGEVAQGSRAASGQGCDLSDRCDRISSMSMARLLCPDDRAGAHPGNYGVATKASILKAVFAKGAEMREDSAACLRLDSHSHLGEPSR
jgi:hypothetical protein